MIVVFKGKGTLLNAVANNAVKLEVLEDRYSVQFDDSNYPVVGTEYMKDMYELVSCKLSEEELTAINWRV